MLWNLGRLTSAKAVLAAQTLQQHNGDILLLSEGNSSLNLDGIEPLPGLLLRNSGSRQRGGVAAVFDSLLLCNWTAISTTEGYAAAKLAYSNGTHTTSIIQLYVSPQDNRDVDLLACCLESLLPHLNGSTIVAGDFNAPHGSSRYSLLLEWCADNGMRVLESAPTHIRHNSTPSHLDLFIVPKQWRSLSITVLPSTHDHQPVLLEISRSIPRQKLPRITAWPRIQEEALRKTFLTQLDTITDVDPFEFLATSGQTILGQARLKRPQMLPSIRKRCEKIEKHLLADLERENLDDLSSARRERVTRLARPGTFWKLLSRQFTPPPDPVHVADDLRLTYSEKSYPATDWASAAASRLCGITTIASGLDRPFTAEEILHCLGYIGKNRAPGPDGIPHIGLRTARESASFVTALVRYYNTFLTSEASLPEFRAILHAIPKPSGGFRPIMIQEKRVSILESLIWNRLRSEEPELLSFPDQYGFTPQLGCFAHLLETKQQLRRLPTACFLDLTKAFDSVPRAFVVACLGDKAGFRFGRLLALAARMTMQQRTAIIAPVRFGISLPISTGVPQGGILSPWLFNCVMAPLQRNVCSVPASLQLRVHLYADDIALFAQDSDAMQQALDAAVASVAEWGGRFNAKKTELLTRDRSHTLVELDGTQLQPQQSATILGRVLQSSGALPLNHDPKPLLRRLRSRLSDGLPPRLGMLAFQAIYWGKTLYASDVFPPPISINRIHLASLRDLLQVCATRAHRCVLQREVGTLFHPAVWVHRRIITRLQQLTPAQRTALLYDESWWKAASSFISDRRTRKDILSNPESQTNSISERISEAIIRDATLKEILDMDDPVWQSISTNPKAYLSLPGACIGALFRSPSMNAPDLRHVFCPFCTRGADTGYHYTYECKRLPTSLDTQRSELSSKAGSRHHLRLQDDAWVKTHMHVTADILQWMHDVYRARAQHNGSLHDRRLFYEVAAVPYFSRNKQKSSLTPRPTMESCPPPTAKSAPPCASPEIIPFSDVAVPLQCAVCLRVFTTAANLSRHLRLAQHVTRFRPPAQPLPAQVLEYLSGVLRCPGCQAQFRKPGYLRTHLRLSQKCDYAITVRRSSVGPPLKRRTVDT